MAVAVTCRMEAQHQPLNDAESSVSLSEDLGLSRDSPSVVSPPTPVEHRCSCKRCLLSLTDHWLFTVLMTLLTVFALVGDDFRLAFTEKESDFVFYSLNSVCLAFFAFDLFIASFMREKYLFSFFFWLDLLSTLSLLADIGWLWDLILGSGISVKQTVRSSQVLRAGRASRAGTRIARILRIVRLIRMTRIVKLYRIAKVTKDELSREDAPGSLQRSNVSFRGFRGPVAQSGVNANAEQMLTEEDSASASFTFGNSQAKGPEVVTKKPSKLSEKLRQMSTFEREENEEIEIPEETKVGKKLSELTTQRTIILVLGLMLALPIFANNLYVDDNTSYSYGLKIIHTFIGGNKDDFDLAWQSYIDQHSAIPTPLIYLEIPGIRLWEGHPHWYDLRMDEQNLVESLDRDFDIFAVFDLQKQSQVQAVLNIGKTVFICLVLGVTAMLFTKDANTLIIGPIEDMVEKVQRIAKNPLEAAQQASKEAFLFNKTSESVFLETVQLERTIEKIGALLAVGFGEAGSDIIVSNMNAGRGEVEPMTPGQRIECIFGFCDIRNFTDATEVLQEGVMQFVNEIALIVHTTVHCFSGAANKNIGDAFLLVWKLPSVVNSEGIEPGLLPEKHFARQLCDMAVMSFLKISARIHKSPTILKYRHDPELNERMPNYSVKMGFGLHAGWAIEGAIGSEYKIDASYLSPHVNMASRLEAATKQYGVSMLFSEQVYQLSTTQTRCLLREVDNVVLKGCQHPTRLFTLDHDPQLLPPEPFSSEFSDKKDLKLILTEKRKELRRAALREKKQITYLYEEDEDFAAMLSEDFTEFKRRFAAGFWRYREGKWMDAVALFTSAEKVRGKKDGPTQTLLHFMQESNNIAPSSWAGFRELTEK